MNIQEVQALTDEEIRVKVAELHGRVRRPDGDWFPLGSTVGSQGIPNYPADLNACHEVEKTLTNERWPAYSSTLWRITNQAPSNYECHATARQRCEALILTLTQP